MRVAVVGAGRMGQAIARAMGKFDCDLILADSNPKNLFANNISWDRDLSKLTLVQSDGKGYDFIRGADVVISAMPYHQNLDLAKACVNGKIKYCDLGGSVPVSDKINHLGKTISDTTLMTDLGLAPGWVNIIAEHMVKGEEVDNVSMMVGGLPKDPNNYLKYNCTWSYDGLINEYKDQCEILVNGMQTIVSGMDGLVTVETELGTLEAFYTSGGASHTIRSMQEKGVKNCNYKTLRYQGHCQAVKFLMNECNLSDESLKEVFKRACPPAEDIVIIRVEVDDKIYETVIESNEKFSAMQQATAFPIAAAAEIIGEGDIGGILGYNDIPYDRFNKNLDYLFGEMDTETSENE